MLLDDSFEVKFDGFGSLKLGFQFQVGIRHVDWRNVKDLGDISQLIERILGVESTILELFNIFISFGEPVIKSTDFIREVNLCPFSLLKHL